MITKTLLIALTIHIIVPLVGLFFFLLLKRKMRKENIQNAPTFELFVIFATYGGLLLVILTELFWESSGLAQLGFFYIVLVAPFIMGFIAYKHRKTKAISKYHKATYFSGLSYFVVAPVTIILLFLVNVIKNM